MVGMTPATQSIRPEILTLDPAVVTEAATMIECFHHFHPAIREKIRTDPDWTLFPPAERIVLTVLQFLDDHGYKTKFGVPSLSPYVIGLIEVAVSSGNSHAAAQVDPVMQTISPEGSIHCFACGVTQSIPSERERIAKLIEEFDDFVYEGRKVEGYSKGTYAMIDGRRTMKALADQVRGMA